MSNDDLQNMNMKGGNVLCTKGRALESDLKQRLNEREQDRQDDINDKMRTNKIGKVSKMCCAKKAQRTAPFEQKFHILNLDFFLRVSDSCAHRRVFQRCMARLFPIVCFGSKPRTRDTF